MALYPKQIGGPLGWSLVGLLCLLLSTAGCGDDSSDDGSGDTTGTTSNGTSSTSNATTSNGTTSNGTTSTSNGTDGMAVTWTSFEDRPCPDDSALTYDNFGGPFLLNWCVGCHNSALPEGMRAGAPMGVDFDTPELVRMWAPRIWARSADDNLGMPPVGGPSAEDRFLIGEWLACGSP